MEYSHTMIADLDASDKPREKALGQGIENLSDAELLAIILGSGMKGMSVLDLSHSILKANDNKLSRLSRLSIHELMAAYKGVGAAKAVSLAAAFELGTRCVHSLALEDESPHMRSSSDIYAYMRQKLERKNHEEFWVVYLNNALRILAAERVSQGSTVATLVDSKIILKRAVDKLATCIALVHNHPSGNKKPSEADDRITKKVSDGAAIFDIRVLDHIIITPAGFYSYADEGRL